jgi:hypothetical protein
MASDDATEFRLSVLNPGGRDAEQYFDEPVAPDSRAHPPINFHAFAACTCGSVHRKIDDAIEEKGPILLLLRGNFKATERALKKCQAANRTVAVALKESGLHQIAQQLSEPRRLARFLRIVRAADGCVATTPEAAEIFRRVRDKHDHDTVVFIPTPYPLEDRQWDFTVSPNEQSGIFVGTREWRVPSRNHAAALLLARQLSEQSGDPVSVFNLDGRGGNRLLKSLGFSGDKLRVSNGRKPYADYLREVARHKIVLQLDRSRVPGQVAGDALLCRTICIGGDGAIERIAFAKFCGEGRTTDQLKTIALELLTNTKARATAIIETQWRAAERLSFQAIQKQLAIFFGQLANHR